MAKSSRTRKVRKGVRKVARKKPSRRRVVVGKFDPRRVKESIERALEQLQPISGMSPKILQLELLLKRCLTEINEIGRSPRPSGISEAAALGRGALEGGKRHPAAASIEPPSRDRTHGAAATEARRESSHESGGGGHDEAAGAPSMSTHGSGPGGFD